MPFIPLIRVSSAPIYWVLVCLAFVSALLFLSELLLRFAFEPLLIWISGMKPVPGKKPRIKLDRAAMAVVTGLIYVVATVVATSGRNLDAAVALAVFGLGTIVGYHAYQVSLLRARNKRVAQIYHSFRITPQQSNVSDDYVRLHFLLGVALIEVFILLYWSAGTLLFQSLVNPVS